MKISHLPIRLTAGAFFLNSGLSKLGMSTEQAAGMKQMGAAGVPGLDKVDDATFAKALPAGEIALGAALLLPFIPSWLAGAGLTAFGGGLVNMYLNTPGMTKDDGFRPTQEGLGLAKDITFVGMGATLVLDSIFSRKRVVKKVTADKIKVRPSRGTH
jgi:hypothetical protein